MRRDAFSIDEKKVEFAAMLVSLYSCYEDTTDFPTFQGFIKYLIEEAGKLMIPPPKK